MHGRESGQDQKDDDIKKEDEVFDVPAPIDYMDLLQEVIEAFDLLKEAMYPVRTIPNIDLHDIVEEHLMHRGK